MSNINSDAESSKRALVRSSATIAAGTMFSRILGFLRDVLIAKSFGTGFRAEAFFLALRIPNLLREMVCEGAANSAVVPVLSEYQQKGDKQEFWRLVSVISAWAMIILSALTILGMTFAPVLVRVLAPGFMADPVKLQLAIDLTRIMFPFLIFIGLAAHTMGVLYTLRSFTAPAFSPAFYNIGIIAGALLSSYFPEPTYGLAFGVLAGGAAQFLLHTVVLLKAGMKLRFVALDHQGAKKCGHLMLPRLLGSGVYQLNLLIDTFCASLALTVGPGGIAAIFYANRLIQLPLGVFGFSMASAALPTLSVLNSQNQMGKFKETVMFSLENIFFFMAPVTVLFVVLAELVIKVLFQRGAFDAYSTQITSMALMLYALGLFSFSGSKILTNAFYGLHDTRTPVKVAIICLAMNAVLNFALMGPLGIGGIALASAISAITGFLILLADLEKRIGRFRDIMGPFIFKILTAALYAGVFLVLVKFYVRPLVMPDLARLVLLGAAGAGMYATACYFLKVEQMVKIVKGLVERGT